MDSKIMTNESTLLQYSDPFIVEPKESQPQPEDVEMEEPRPSTSKADDFMYDEPMPGTSKEDFLDEELGASYQREPGVESPDKSRIPPFGKRKKISDLATDITSDTRGILNLIASPKEWRHNGLLWRQEVSMEPVSRTDVWNLWENLDLRLKERNARDRGICAIRMELFAQAFDEIIRQVTLNCLERGMLLLRIRDEYHLTIAVHRALCEGSVIYGSKKASEAEVGKTEIHEDIDKIKDENAQIEKEIMVMDSKFLMLERRAEELRSTQEKNQAEEINFLKKTNQQLKAQLESIAAPKR